MADLPKMWAKMSKALKQKWWAAHGGGKPFPAEEGGRSAAKAKKLPTGKKTSELSRGEKTAAGFRMSAIRRENQRRMLAAMQRGTAGGQQPSSSSGSSLSSAGDFKRAIKSGDTIKTGLGGHSDLDKLLPEPEKKKKMKEEVEQTNESKEAKDLSKELSDSIKKESGGKHMLVRNKSGTLVIRRVKKMKEEVEQMDEAVTLKQIDYQKGHKLMYKDGKQKIVRSKASQLAHREQGWKERFSVRAAEKAGLKKEEVEQVEEQKKIPVFTHKDVRNQQRRLTKLLRKKAAERAATEGEMRKMGEEVEYIEEKLTAADPASKWISDFVKSDNPKFAGKSKRERINQALGAYYAKKRAKNEEVVQEKMLDPVGKETADIDNDKDVDKTDKYLHARRQAISKAIAKKKGM